MFSFIKKYAESLAGVDVYGDIGLLIFVVVFVAVTWFALRASKEYMAALSHIPFEDSTRN